MSQCEPTYALHCCTEAQQAFEQPIVIVEAVLHTIAILIVALAIAGSMIGEPEPTTEAVALTPHEQRITVIRAMRKSAERIFLGNEIAPLLEYVAVSRAVPSAEPPPSIPILGEHHTPESSGGSWLAVKPAQTRCTPAIRDASAIRVLMLGASVLALARSLVLLLAPSLAPWGVLSMFAGTAGTLLIFVVFVIHLRFYRVASQLATVDASGFDTERTMCSSRAMFGGLAAFVATCFLVTDASTAAAVLDEGASDSEIVKRFEERTVISFYGWAIAYGVAICGFFMLVRMLIDGSHEAIGRVRKRLSSELAVARVLASHATAGAFGSSRALVATGDAMWASSQSGRWTGTRTGTSTAIDDTVQSTWSETGLCFANWPCCGSRLPSRTEHERKQIAEVLRHIPRGMQMIGYVDATVDKVLNTFASHADTLRKARGVLTAALYRNLLIAVVSLSMMVSLAIVAARQESMPLLKAVLRSLFDMSDCVVVAIVYRSTLHDGVVRGLCCGHSDSCRRSRQVVPVSRSSSTLTALPKDSTLVSMDGSSESAPSKDGLTPLFDPEPARRTEQMQRHIVLDHGHDLSRRGSGSRTSGSRGSIGRRWSTADHTAGGDGRVLPPSRVGSTIYSGASPPDKLSVLASTREISSRSRYDVIPNEADQHSSMQPLRRSSAPSAPNSHMQLAMASAVAQLQPDV